MRRNGKLLIIPGTHLVAVRHAEEAILLIMHIEYLGRAGIAFLQVFIIVYPYRLYRVYRHTDDVLHKRRLRVSVCFYGRNRWFLHLYHTLVFAFALVDHYIVISKVFVGKINNVFLSEPGKLVGIGHIIEPVFFTGKSAHQGRCAGAVFLILLHHGFLGIVHYRYQQVIIKVAFFQVVYFAEHQGLYVFEVLAEGRCTLQLHVAVVYHHLSTGRCAE